MKATIINAWNWLRRWGWVAVVIVGAVLAVLFKRKTLPGTRVDEEIAAAKADAETARVLATQGHEAALKAVEEKYASAKVALEDHEHAQAVELKNDPRALSRFLAKAATRRDRGVGRVR